MDKQKIKKIKEGIKQIDAILRDLDIEGFGRQFCLESVITHLDYETTNYDIQARLHCLFLDYLEEL